MERWGIWCVTRGGVTGFREAWLKKSGKVAEFDTFDEADAEARDPDQSYEFQPLP